MRQHLTYGGIDSRLFGVYISGNGVIDSPARAYNEIVIPGRNGVLLGSEKRLEALELIYPAFIIHDILENARRFKAALYSKTGFQTLVDTYYPDEFRMAVFRSGLVVETAPAIRGGFFDLTFQCRPERFLFQGLVPLRDYEVILNPTDYEAKPIIRIFGTGTLTINDISITVTDADEYTDIDCEMMEAYKGDFSRNAFIELSGNDFPSLVKGKNYISKTGNITSYTITPRWWVL